VACIAFCGWCLPVRRNIYGLFTASCTIAGPADNLVTLSAMVDAFLFVVATHQLWWNTVVASMDVAFAHGCKCLFPSANLKVVSAIARSCKGKAVTSMDQYDAGGDRQCNRLMRSITVMLLKWP